MRRLDLAEVGVECLGPPGPACPGLMSTARKLELGSLLARGSPQFAVFVL